MDNIDIENLPTPVNINEECDIRKVIFGLSNKILKKQQKTKTEKFLIVYLLPLMSL